MTKISSKEQKQNFTLYFNVLWKLIKTDKSKSRSTSRKLQLLTEMQPRRQQRSNLKNPSDSKVTKCACSLIPYLCLYQSKYFIIVIWSLHSFHTPTVPKRLRLSSYFWTLFIWQPMIITRVLSEVCKIIK